ncbi:MAG: sugar-binding protein [Selenomonadaceae bacterium]|nr:sugar-binding protein [Selenomonadaceae bacterium]
MRKIFLILCLILCTFVTGCADDGNQKASVQLLFPNPNFGGIWNYIGKKCAEMMSEAGYNVEMRFCQDANDQIAQLKDAIEKHPAAIVIAAQDTGALAEPLKLAKEEGIPVIAYDRVIMHTDAISYYASFENNSVGEFQARYVEEKLNLKSGAGPFTIEFIAGSPDDTNAPLFYSGAYEYLKPYIDKGQLVVPSGQTAFSAVATDGWKKENAQKRMTEILQKYYADGKSLNVVIASNDDLAEALLNAQQAVGYKGATTILTGQDAGANGVANIKSGKQAMTIYKDPAILCAKIVRMVKAVVEGSQPAINDVTNIKNDVMTIPSYLCIPMIVDKENIGIVKNFN